MAQKEKRIVLSFDKDFGTLAFHAGLSASCGVVLVRLPKAPPNEMIRLVMEVFEEPEKWRGKFVVIHPSKTRITILPNKK